MRKTLLAGLALYAAMIASQCLAADAGPQERDENQLLIEAAEKYRQRESLRRELDQEAAFDEAFQQEFSATPQQIRKARQRRDQLEEAAQLPVPGRGGQRTQSVSLKPGARNAVIRCYPQYATVIRILDSNGQPWPIMAHMIGNAANFQVQKPDMEPYDTIIVSPLVSTGSTNLALMLDNLDGEAPVPPLSLQLVVSPGNGGNYDSVASIRIDRRGPRSPAPHGDGDAPTADAAMLAFLDGVPPKGAGRLRTSDKSVEAWDYGGMLYIRASRKLVWPAWQKAISSGEADGGINVYALPPVTSVMLAGNRSVSIGRYPEAVTRAMEGN